MCATYRITLEMYIAAESEALATKTFFAELLEHSEAAGEISIERCEDDEDE